MIPAGKYAAMAVGAEYGVSTNKGTEYVAVTFEVVTASAAGERIQWFGYCTDKTIDRTMKSLVLAGFTGNDPSDPLQLATLSGGDVPTVQIVVEHEEYKGDLRAKVQWVNALPAEPAAGQKSAFAAKAAEALRAARKELGLPEPESQPNPGF